MDLFQSNHGIIVVTDVVVAPWYVVIIVAQLKEHTQHHGPILTVSTYMPYINPIWTSYLVMF